jgi:hypothetical protein
MSYFKKELASRQGKPEGRRYILGTQRSLLNRYETELLKADCHKVQERFEVKRVDTPDGKEVFILCRSQARGERNSDHYRYVICGTMFLSYTLVYCHSLCPAVIALDMQEAFKASGTLLGVLKSAYFCPYAVMQLPVGLLADSWGPRKTIASSLALAWASSITMGRTGRAMKEVSYSPPR